MQRSSIPGDVVELSKSDWWGRCHIANETRKVPHVDVFTAGFECDDVCKVARRCKPSAGNCLETGEGRTGSTGRAVLKAVVAYRFKLTMLENSSIVGEANIRYITNYLNYFGFFVLPVISRAEDFGSPSRRERQYLIIVPLSSEAIDQFKEDFQEPAWANTFRTALNAMHIGPGKPSAVLLPKTSPMYQVWLAEQRLRRADMDVKEAERLGKLALAGKQPKEQKSEEKWIADHIDLFRPPGNFDSSGPSSRSGSPPG